MKLTPFTVEEQEHIRQAREASILMDYNEAYYRWVFGPEKDEKADHERLAKLRHLYFSI